MSLGTLPQTIVVTVTYGQRVERVTETVRRAVAAGCTAAVVVLNGCSEMVESSIREELADVSAVTYHRERENLGSAGGFGAGLACAGRIDGWEYVWILDDDNWCEPRSLTGAMTSMANLEAIHGQGHVGVACLRLDSDDHRQLMAGVPSSIVFPSPGAAGAFDLRTRLQRRRTAARSDEADRGDRDIEVPFAPYGGLLLPRAALETGLPRSDYVLYEDDWEFSERLRRDGLRLFVSVQSRLHDVEEAGTDKSDGAERPAERLLRTPPESQYRLYYQLRNRTHLSRSRARSVPERFWFAVNLVAYIAGLTVLAVPDPANRVAYGCALRAVRDGLTDRMGRTWPLPS